MINFILQLKAFDEMACENLTPNAIAIYYRLFHINNRCGWKEWFTESDFWLGRAVGIKRRETILAAINLLKQKGFIDFERGNKKNQPTRYKIYALNNSAKDSVEGSVKDSAKDSAEPSAKDSAKDSDNPNYKTETKNKNIYGVDGFAEFWTAYPRKEKKQEAAKSYRKLKADKDMQAVILRAVETFKQTEQWQKDGGRYIPYAVTWLNQRRWEDEVAVKPPRPFTDEDNERI